MSRFGNQQTGVVVSVADEKDHRFGLGWKRLADGEVFEKDTRSRRRTHDDPTPSGRIPRQQAREETPTGQIRRQQAAADPFNR